MYKYIILLLGLIPITTAQSQTNQTTLKHSIYLIGDAGDPVDKSKHILSSLSEKLQQANQDKTSVVFLGDNIYPEGLHKKSNPDRAEDEKRLNAQLNIVKNFDGRILFIPGNHDWDKGQKGGLKHIKRQEKYIQNYLDKGNVFRPSHGCPGPEIIKVSNDLTFVIIDTQWWLHPHDKSSGDKDKCDVLNNDEFMAAFNEALKKNRDKNVVVLAHHPLISNGSHGGYFTTKEHLFPLTSINKNLYIPLPIIGSIYPYYRKYIGNIQDISHPTYKDMASKIKKAMNEYDNIIYVAGHEHNLQYAQDGSYHHVISGSGSKSTHVRKNKKLEYGSSSTGYALISQYENGDIWLEFTTVNQQTGEEKIGFKKFLFKGKKAKSIKPTKPVEKIDYSNQYATVIPDSSFDRGKIHRFFMGNMHRDLWATPIKVPYLNIHFEKGGLTPIKKGGGMQTISLRLQGGDGKQYVVRGIKKSAKFLIEKNLRGTLAQDAIYDAISGSHPYASVTIGKLCKAAGVYHTNPKLVYVPNDPILGDYQEEFGGMFCLFEERPDGDMSDEESFGNSKDVLGYSDVYENVHSKYNHQIDQESVLNARLLDIVIGDWDRHDDQWRWASIKDKKKDIYRPIPRDRDQAFFRFDGIFPWIANRKWLLRKFQPFKKEIRDLKGVTFNARYFDRSNLNDLEKDQWLAITNKIQNNLTDEVITDAIKTFPQEAYDFSGESIINTLKHRRDHLEETATKYYNILAKEVDIPGTFKNDYFEVHRMKDGKMQVNIYPRKKDAPKKDKIYYSRIFNPEETKEVRLYGLDGKDEFNITGESDKSIKLRIITSDEKNKITDESKVKGSCKKTQIYTSNDKNKISSNGEARTRIIKRNFDKYEYNRKEFVNDKFSPSIQIGQNANDGFYIGPKLTITKQGFKKSPFREQHTLWIARTFKAKGWNAFYNYRNTELIGPFDLDLALELNAPSIYQYYGKGNESVKIESTDEVNVTMNDYKAMPSLQYRDKNNTQTFKIGASVRHVSFEDLPETVDQSFVSEHDLLGFFLGYEYKNMDKPVNASRGIHFDTKAGWTKDFTDNSVKFWDVKASLSLYFPINLFKKQTVLAMRSGAEKNFGDYSFFQSKFLDGTENFRGVKRNRFAGDAIQFNNIDLRQSLLKLHTYAAPFDIGILGHFDAAKSWTEGIPSKKWHTSYGGGIFLDILDYFSIQATYSISQDDKTFTMGAFLF